MVPGARRWVSAAVVLVALAGCGGGDDPGPSAFGAATDRTCRELTVAVADLREGLLRAAAPSERAGLATALRRYAAAVGRSADALAATSPPRADAAFRDAAVRGLRTHATTMRAAATGAARGRVAPGLREELRGGSLPTVPAAVLAGAPGCRRPAR
jgi:hypothetical protein